MATIAKVTPKSAVDESRIRELQISQSDWHPMETRLRDLAERYWDAHGRREKKPVGNVPDFDTAPSDVRGVLDQLKARAEIQAQKDRELDELLAARDGRPPLSAEAVAIHVRPCGLKTQSIPVGDSMLIFRPLVPTPVPESVAERVQEALRVGNLILCD